MDQEFDAIAGISAAGGELYLVPVDPMVPTRSAVTALRAAAVPAGVGPLLQCDSCQ